MPTRPWTRARRWGGRAAATLTGLALVTALSGCITAAVVAGGRDDAKGTAGAGSGAGGSSTTFDSAVIVDAGYQMDVVTQEMTYTYEHWTLFTDGTAYAQLPTVALADFDVEASRSAHPKQWGVWRVSAGKLEVGWGVRRGESPAKWSTYKDWFRLEAAAPGETLDASFSALNTVNQDGVYGSAFGTGWKVLTLTADGRFVQSSGGSVDLNQDGDSIYSGATDESRGTYRFDGPLLELTFADGHTTRASAFFSGSNRKTMLLDGVTMQRGGA